MKAVKTATPAPLAQNWRIAIGEHAGHLEHAEALSASVRVVLSGEHAGTIELGIHEQAENRIAMSAAEAESLAHLFVRMRGLDGRKLADALLDAAHLARSSKGEVSARTPTEALAEPGARHFHEHNKSHD